MLKDYVTSQEVCDLLNELLKIDYTCVHNLISHRERCNKKFAEHPTVQVKQYKTDKFPVVGIIGIINGLFGIREDGMGAICFEFNNEKILKFKLVDKEV